VGEIRKRDRYPKRTDKVMRTISVQITVMRYTRFRFRDSLAAACAANMSQCWGTVAAPLVDQGGVGCPSGVNSMSGRLEASLDVAEAL
jgi:hypothetical protein